jgi:GTP-binding protein LepA
VERHHLRRRNSRRAHSQARRNRQLVAGEVGFIIANIKNVADTKIGDTITHDANPALEALPGFEEIKPMVFAGLYTVDAHEHTQLREALEKLRLNDSSFFFEPESSA